MQAFRRVGPRTRATSTPPARNQLSYSVPGELGHMNAYGSNLAVVAGACAHGGGTGNA